MTWGEHCGAFSTRSHSRDGAAYVSSNVLPLHSIAESEHGQNEIARAMCAAGVQIAAPLPEPLPAELALIVERWSDLPEHIRAAVLALVGTAKT